MLIIDLLEDRTSVNVYHLRPELRVIHTEYLYPGLLVFSQRHIIIA